MTNMKHILSSLILLQAVMSGAHAAVVTEEVSYKDGDTVMKGFIAYDDAVKGKRPGVLVVHEWWGHNAHARNGAKKLAAAGYTALAVDMYGDGKLASHPKDAGKFSGMVKKNQPLMQARFNAAYEQLKKHKTVNPVSMAAIGYCFGGNVVLRMAVAGADLDAVVSFHGGLGGLQAAKKGKVKAKLLVLNGADDPFIKPEHIAAFKKNMGAAGVDYTFINYPGAKHAFTNPEADVNSKKFNIPLQYNAAADKASWDEMLALFKQVFGN